MQLLSEDKKKIKNAMQEASNSLLRIDAERDLIKNIIVDLFDAYQIPKKQLKKMIKVYYKQTFHQEVAEHEEFEHLYEDITIARSNDDITS